MVTNAEIKEGSRVRLRSDPGRIGIYTGRKRTAGGFLLLEIKFGENDYQNIRSTQLELVPEHETMYDLFDSGRFGGPGDLAKIITTTKLAGDITNVFYSMGIGNTEFFAHQFKPVLKFIESPRGRLLIADEVGLGKTIEAIYIWKELQARDGARRLLIVCPSMLCEKWKRDLEVRFGEEAEIVKSKTLFEKLQEASRSTFTRSFMLITSIEGIRAKASDGDVYSLSDRAKLRGFLEEMAENSSKPILDLIVIDEAHYLRNSATASHQTATILRENTNNLLLLSATPIQTSGENLYNLLKLLSPEEYGNQEIFEALLESNSGLIELANIIRYRPIEQSAELITHILTNYENVIGIDLVNLIRNTIEKKVLTPEERIDLSRRISERTYFNQYINRTRKRDVIENRVIRVPKTFVFKFNDYEKYLYESVTKFLREKAVQNSTLSAFVMIARQRQMTSCLPAAFKHWKDHNSMNEQLWDDLGIDVFEEDAPPTNIKEDLNNIPLDFKLEKLERFDSKYTELKKQLGIFLKQYQNEKIIIFSFYRGTISYLSRRLSADGFRVVSIVGGMNSEKYDIIESFSKQDGPNILISSEVGAEGIDLQFCHILINYDLPWNPMKLEQRIGRIDRIGQKSDKIFVYNITCDDTIEDRVLSRLYERINIFRSSIGDLEDILGEIVESLAFDLIDPSLTDQDRLNRAEQNILAIEEKRKLRNELEDKAIDLFGFGDYIIRTINEAQQLERFVGPLDTLHLVQNFFSSYYPGTKTENYKNGPSLLIKLSPEAKASLSSYLEENRPIISTQLNRYESEILCIFDPKLKIEKTKYITERIDAIHPLIRWIIDENKKKQNDLQPCSAIILKYPDFKDSHGIYTYFVNLWQAEGWKIKKELHFFAAPIGGLPISSNEAEKLIVNAFRKGKKWSIWEEYVTISEASKTLNSLVDNAYDEFIRFENSFRADNAQLCSKQEEYAIKTAKRKADETEELIKRLESEGKTKVIPIHKKRIIKINEQFEYQMARIKKYKEPFTNNIDLAIGIIKVE